MTPFFGNGDTFDVMASPNTLALIIKIKPNHINDFLTTIKINTKNSHTKPKYIQFNIIHSHNKPHTFFFHSNIT